MTATAPELAVRPAIEVWLGFAPAPPLAAGVLEVAQADPFAVFDAMRATGVADVRKVGVLCSTPLHVAAARAAGAGAVVAVGDAVSLSAAAPDALVPPEQLDALGELALRRGRVAAAARPAQPGAGADERRREARRRRCGRLPPGDGVPPAGPPDPGQAARPRGRPAGLDDRTPLGFRYVRERGVAARRRSPRKRLLVVVNGVYGDRLREAARRAGIETVSVEGPWTEPIEPARVRDALAAEPGLDALAVVHHETTTGLLNPLAELVEAAHAAGVRTVVDAISSFGVEEIALGDGIDFLTCTSNKCLHGLPGAAFVVVSPAGARRARSIEPSSVALDLCAYLDVDASGSPPFTPAIPALASLDVALDRVLVEGVAGRRARYSERCAIVDAAFERLGLEQLIAEPARSHSIRSVRLPEGVSFAALHERLRADGFVIYAGQGALATEIFRVACMGELEPSDLHAFAGALERALAVHDV